MQFASWAFFLGCIYLVFVLLRNKSISNDDYLDDLVANETIIDASRRAMSSHTNAILNQLPEMSDECLARMFHREASINEIVALSDCVYWSSSGSNRRLKTMVLSNGEGCIFYTGRVGDGEFFSASVINWGGIHGCDVTQCTVNKLPNKGQFFDFDEDTFLPTKFQIDHTWSIFEFVEMQNLYSKSGATFSKSYAAYQNGSLGVGAVLHSLRNS
jgi:hypothetical protein